MKRNTLFRTASIATLCASASVAHAGQCFNFDKLSEGVTYTVGDVIETDIATIRVLPYVVDGEPATAATRGAKRSQSQIAGGSSPELDVKLVALVIEPTKPASRITTRIAQNISATGAFGNSGLAVNRKGRKSDTGFAGLDGKVLGSSQVGKAKVSANLAAPTTGNWHVGTLELNAVQGHIERFRLGTHTYKIDEFCIYP